MAAPTGSRRTRSRASTPASPADGAPAPTTDGAVRGHGEDPDGGTGGVHELLTAAVEETARLLKADGAMVYLLDRATGRLHFAHDAGIRSARSREWVREIELEIGTGMFGQAVATRTVVITDDYSADPTFRHAADPDRVVEDIGIRSMVVAPLVAGDEVFGALGAFSTRTSAFDDPQIALVRSLADHAAAAMANATLIEALDRSRTELAEKAEIERALREINARISAASDLSAVLQRAVDEAARLLHADGARIDLIDARSGLLRWAYASGALKPDDDVWPDDPDETLDQGISGQSVITGRAFWTGDYAHDDRFPHGAGADTYIEASGITSVMAAPLIGEDGPFGSLTIFTGARDAWSAVDAEVLEAIAAQSAIAITRARLLDELDRSRGALARRAEAEQALREIAARITALRDPAEILQEVIELASRLVRGQGAILDLLEPGTTNLRWAYDDGLGRRFTDEERAKLWISVGVGATGTAVAEDRVVIAGDDLSALFPPSPESTEFYERTGFHSMIAAPITGDDGPLGVIEVYAVQSDAFDEVDAALIQALAGQAAIAITNARLITELASSRAALGRTAEAERTLREIAAQVSAMRDQDQILQAVVDAATRLLRANGAMIDLIAVPRMTGAWTQADDARIRSNRELLAEIEVDPDAGVSGRAIVNQQVVRTGDYLEDDRFTHTPERDAFVREGNIKSVVAAPLLQRGAVLGAITVYSTRLDGFDDADAAVLAGLADQAAVAIATVNLIEELERSRAEVARRADAERTLREIAARVTAILDPAEVLQRIVDEAARLLESDGSRIDLYDPEIDALRWSYAAGPAMSVVPDWARAGGLKANQAVAGTAFAEQRPVRTDDYLADDRFVKDDNVTTFVRETGIRSVIAVPLGGEAGPLGTLSVVARQPGAYDDADMDMLAALGAQASIAITNANLMAQLNRSRADIERRAEAESTLREIGARITALREPDDVLQRVVNEAFRLLRADGAVIDQFDEDSQTLQWAYDSGISEAQREGVKLSNLRLGEGVSGKAVAENRVITVGDYERGEFRHDELADSLAAGEGIRDLIVAPIIGDTGPLGAIEVFSRQPYRFDEIDAAVLGGLAEQAAIAITNARLIDELERSQAALARRAETERSLRDITARIAALRDPDEVLERVVEDAKRLLATDGAHLTRMSESGTYLVPVVVAGASDDLTRDWLLDMEFPLGDGINGLAAEQGTPIWTFDYLADPRIPHEADDLVVAERLGLRGMAAAPLRAPGGEVIGTLAVSAAEPRTFEADELDLLQGLADQAAIALTNSRLLERLTREEARFRGLVQTMPDVLWRADADGYFTFMADSAGALFGWPVDRIIGQHFGFLTDPGSMALAGERYAAVAADPELVDRVPITLVRQDGSTFAAEVTTAGVFEDGRFVGAQGTVRDVSERERLEQELRRSEERYRYLVQNAPDIVWSVDDEARLTFLSDATERLTGFRPEELLGQHFGAIVHPSSRDVAEIDWTEALFAPSQEIRGRINLLHRDGSSVPAEFIAVASLDGEGRFAGANGSVRDMSDRDRLERELRGSQERYKTLASSSPDLVFATDAAGHYTFLSDRAASMLGWDLSTSLGRPFLDFVAPGWEPAAVASFGELMADPSAVHSTRLDFLRGDGETVPLEINVVGSFEDGELTAIHGVARDVSERERLQEDLRRSEERYRFLVEQSPDIVFTTDGEGRFTFLSEAIERMTAYRPEELVGEHFSIIVDESTLPVAAERWANVEVDPNAEVAADLILKGRDGRRTPVDVRATGLVTDGKFVGIQGATRDVSEQVRLEGELRRQAGELAAGEERAHLARELHDSVTQALFSMTLVTRSIEMLLARDPETAMVQLGQLRDLQREALAEMRALIFELRPGNLEQDGLVRALKTHSSALQGRIGLPIVVESDLEGRLPLAAEEGLYRIAQEALHNIVKHAAARQVWLEVRSWDGTVRLRVQDDGKGFDPGSVPDGHLGLAGMRARADRMGGTFACTSKPGHGTTIEVTLPPAALESIAASTALADGHQRALPTESPSIRDV
ncbi:MAG TPA: GAF domain-containing protein [Candidatus Saccharimonadales bacterium]|nr:GAF domain-containing protein [Candidatus Saccharimonadales bacterium]